MNSIRCRATPADSVLVVIDVQDKLLAKMPAAEDLVRSIGFLIDVAKLLGIPVRCTEQYPKGLGPTVAELASRIPGERLAKTAFSCCGAAGFLQELRTLARSNVILVGMESHVCVAQTALDLLDAGFSIHLPIDAIASRSDLDRTWAFHRLDRAGASLTTAEALAFEWFGDAHHPQFKTFSQLVIARSAPRP